MGSKVISFRLPKELYEKFDQQCEDEEVSITVKLRQLVDSVCHYTEVDTEGKAPVKVIEVEGDKLEKVTDTRVKSWFPFDFSPLFGKGR